MNKELNFIDLDKQIELDRVSANIHYQIAQTFSEQDAEGAIRAIVEKYPGIVMKVLAKRYIHNLATLEAVGAMLKEWG